MSKRPHISAKTKVDVAFLQAQYSRPMHGITCPLCHEELGMLAPRILEHMNPRELSKDDSVENLRWVHKHCADLKTRGAEGASKKHSIANGDTHRIRKAGRIADGGKKVRRPMRKVPDDLKELARRLKRELRAKLKAEGRL